VLDERLDATQRLGQREDAGRGADRERAVHAARPERDHAAEPALLAGCELVPRVGLETGVDHLGHARVAREELGDRRGVGAVPVHAHREGLETAQREPRVERTGDRT